MQCLQQTQTTLCQEAIHFIRHAKYELCYQMVLGFAAGLLSTKPHHAEPSPALIYFWQALLSHPLDLTGFHHFRIIIHCLEQAQCDARIPYHSTLLKSIRTTFNLLKKDKAYPLLPLQNRYFALLRYNPAVSNHCCFIKV